MINNKKDYEEFFNHIGLSEKESQSRIVACVRELFAIAIQHYNNETVKTEGWA